MPHLSEVHETVVVPSKGTGWQRWLAITGPAIMVAVGYMDPGNWATDLAAGSRYNYALLWVLLMSNMMAVLLQRLASRLGIVSRRDLAQVNHEEYHPVVNIPLYILAEIAITACDLAEVLGSAIALQLLFGLPLIYGVILTALDTFLLLLMSNAGIRKLESIVLAMVGTIGAAFIIEIMLGQPDWKGIVQGFVPSMPDSAALFIAIGILGATVMPHNLYLHSSLVQTRKIGTTKKDIRDAIRMNNIDTAVALNLAFLVNAAILIVAAAVFYRTWIPRRGRDPGCAPVAGSHPGRVHRAGCFCHCPAGVWAKFHDHRHAGRVRSSWRDTSTCASHPGCGALSPARWRSFLQSW